MLNMVTLPSRGTWLAIAGGTAAFLGWCIYYDRKRRSAPNFRENLIARRKAERAKSRKSNSARFAGAVPDLRDTETRQRFFMQEVQLGEALLSQGEIEEGVLHLANAAAACGETEQFVQMLANTLPREILQLIVASLPGAQRRIQAAQQGGGSDKKRTTARVTEIEEVDVE